MINTLGQLGVRIIDSINYRTAIQAFWTHFSPLPLDIDIAVFVVSSFLHICRRNIVL